MADRQFRTVLEGGSYFEGPRWHEGSWWVSDFYRHTVSRVTPDGAKTVVLEVENQPSGLGRLPDGSLLVVSMKDQRLLCSGSRPAGRWSVRSRRRTEWASTPAPWAGTTAASC